MLREPLTVAAIAPFNFPQTPASLKHGPALAAGCTLVLKPSPDTVLDAFLFAEAVAASDIPPGVVNLVTGGGEMGAYLVSHPGIDRVGFTGGTCRISSPITAQERCALLRALAQSKDLN
ncbi:aldehyde dehydrogenase family protein [Streptomyces sp. B21-101]|uniref:aldehyde dehydrogenase family protein n=1 Tax=Streptomyces sp. B21-101 TaxID=3039415 RepID=UPI002FF31003